MYIEIKNWKG